jgi:hypothetical protein
LSRLLRKASTFLRQPLFVKAWLVPVWLMLGVSRAVILAVSFKRLAPWIGIHDGVAAWVPLLDRAQEARAVEIGRVVQMAAKYTPWKSNCFPQALTARALLGLYKIPYGLYFGLAKRESNGELHAHAWVASGRVRVTGGAGFDEFTVVGCFVSDPA